MGHEHSARLQKTFGGAAEERVLLDAANQNQNTRGEILLERVFSVIDALDLRKDEMGLSLMDPLTRKFTDIYIHQTNLRISRLMCLPPSKEEQAVASGLLKKPSRESVNNDEIHIVHERYVSLRRGRRDFDSSRHASVRSSVHRIQFEYGLNFGLVATPEDSCG